MSLHWSESVEAIKEAVIGDVAAYIGARTVYDGITLVVLKQQWKKANYHMTSNSGACVPLPDRHPDAEQKIAALTAELSESFEQQAGQTVYAEGEAGDKFYIVVRGMVSISTLDAAQQTIRLAELQDGDYFGEVEMVNKGRRTTTVRAATPSLVLALYAEHFDRMVEELGLLSKVVTQMALGRSLSTICSVGRRRRSHPVWKELSQRKWD